MNTKGVEDGISEQSLLQRYRAKHKDCKDLTGHPDSLKSMAKDWRCDLCKQVDLYSQPKVKCKCGHPKHVSIDGTQSCGYCCNEYGRGKRMLEDVCSVYIPADKAAVPESPTFSYQLAMYLTRNGADAPHMQAEINRFLYVNGWQARRVK